MTWDACQERATTRLIVAKKIFFTLMASLQSHRSTLYLLFSPKCLPYAEVAQFYLSGKNPETLRLGISSNLLMTQPTLIIPKGIYSDQKQVLMGKPSILRFFNRLGQNGLASPQVNTIVDQLRNAPLNDSAILSKLDSKSFLDGDVLSIADLKAWDYMTRSAVQSEFFKKLDGMEELKKAKESIRRALEDVPVMDHYKYAVIEQLVEILQFDISFVTANLIRPKKGSDVGDVAIPVPALKLQGNPVQLAKEIASKVKVNEFIAKVTAQGPFVHFFFTSPAMYYKGITQAIKMGKQFGKNSSGYGKFAVCEYSSPNIAKPFHAGHLRSTIIGSFIEKLLKHCGWQTISINYLGDWGKQVLMFN
jgi:arginyl-tRNA synthetase